MRNVLWICAAVASALTLVDARAEGEGLSANADRVPWARFQSRFARARCARLARRPRPVRAHRPAGRQRRAPRRRLFRLDAGAPGHIRGRLPCHERPPDRRAQRLARRRRRRRAACSRRIGGCSALRPIRSAYPADPTVDNATLPYIGIGYSNLSPKSGWSFSADLGVVSQSPGNVVRFGRVFGGSQSLDDVFRDMRLAPVVQLGVSYSF